MKWIKITNDNLPPFREEVIVTDQVFNKQEGICHKGISRLNGIWEDEFGRKPEWDDVNDSGITKPTHFCIIPNLDDID